MPARDQATVALKVAIAAGVLLVAIVGLDVIFNSPVSLDVRDDGDWANVAGIPEDRDRFSRTPQTLEVNRSDTVEFRVTVDNQRPIGYDEAFSVHVHGQVVADGPLSAERFGTDEETFPVEGATLLGDGPSKTRPEGPPSVGASIQLTVDGETTYGFLDVREVSR